MKLFIQSAAEEDILLQVEWYSERGLSDIALRFQDATRAAIDALAARPAAGAPRYLKNPQLAGLRIWPIKGFDALRVYYLSTPELVTIVRILHGKRDIGVMLEDQDLTDPSLS